MGKLSLAEQVRLVEDFLNDNFAFRHNEVSDTFEYKVLKPEMGDMPANPDYEPVSDEALNSIILEAMKSGIEGKVTDLIKRIICSKTTETYNPLVSYLDGLPKWDGVDRVGELIHRIPGVDDEKEEFARRWFRSEVAHWSGLDKIYGNQLVLLFIGKQGCGKGSYIKKLLPEHLQKYYLDHINLTNKHDTDMALANCGLVNFDEFDRYTDKQQATLKYIITKAEVNARKIYGKNITLRARMASFVATTNVVRPLKDRTGTRRFVVLQIPFGTIIPDQPIDYDQLYAQLKHEVCEEKKIYWLNQEENERLQVLNQEYCAIDDFTAMISTCFRKPNENEESRQMTSLEILAAVQQKYPEIELTRRNQSLLGINLSSMGITNRRLKNGKVYDVVQIAA